MSNDTRLDRPAELPAEFKGWLVRYLEDHFRLGDFLRLVSPGARLARGSSSWTWTGVSSKATTQVTHTLTTTPTVVVVTPGIGTSSGLTLPPAPQVTAADASTFDVIAETIDGSTPAFSDNCPFTWIAIG